jgi:hypothetical protein
MFEFRKVASALARRTKDTDDDKSTDLDIAQASHALKVLREIAAENPEQVLSALKLMPLTASVDRNLRKGAKRPIQKRRRYRKPRQVRRFIRHLYDFSTLYSRS